MQVECPKELLSECIRDGYFLDMLVKLVVEEEEGTRHDVMYEVLDSQYELFLLF